MQFYPALAELSAFRTEHRVAPEHHSAPEYRAAPVATEILSDSLTPVTALKILKNVSDHVYMLESAGQDQTWGRYTFLGYDPKLEITAVDGQVRINDQPADYESPSDAIREVLARYRSPKIPGMPPFAGGLVGYFSYDYVKYAEPTLRLDAPNEEGFNDVDLMLFDTVIAFDNFRQKIILIKVVGLDNLEEEYPRATEELRELARLLLHGEPVADTTGRLTGPITPVLNEAEFVAMVERAKHYIHEGDIFQIVLSNCLRAEFTGSLIDTYRVLRTINPSPYMFYFSGHNIEVAGASPETLVKLEDGTLFTFPLAGTRPRGATPAEDARLEKELLADPKELAEHNMLVDLGRNDIGRLAQFGTVNVDRFHDVVRFSHVMHIGSTVSGKIRPECDALDAVASILPAGTLSGAPKIRACQLINDLEGNKRGIYGGAIGYLDFSGNLDTCIGIRIAYKIGNTVYARSGAGIVQDSVAATEYQETLNKAAAVLEALHDAAQLEECS
ncbi:MULTISPECIES: anthranilate synthase component I family protein [Actinomycetaceae]|uniref:anthranilate synthase component I family protein n=1 Tax=Actinomycetaceae TaxID=2049 RepID=UPI00237EDC8C|nr:chorismate-binding protein [Actinotignum sanguinis]MDE1642688.1 chorismate-binding protein [Actinotignum sanguinis]